MLVAVAYQLLEQTFILSDTEDVIELSDPVEDNEEEIEDKVTLLVIESVNARASKVSPKKTFPILRNKSHIQKYYRKIPVPPPELV